MNNVNPSGISSPSRLEGENMAMVASWFLGLGSLVSWNSLLTIEDYYYDLFPCYHPSRVLTLVYQPFAFGTAAILTYNEEKIDTRKRNLAGYILFFLSTLGLLVLDLATSGKGGIGNYIGICVFVACFGVADGLVQGGMVGDLSFMCPQFIQSFFAGLAASGALTAALRLITKAAFDKFDNGLRMGVMLYLAISIFFEFLCILLYASIFPKIPIVKYFRSRAAAEGSETVSSDLVAAGIHIKESEGVLLLQADDANHERLSNNQLLFQNLDYAFDLYLIYVLTLSIIPGFLYENTGSNLLGSWYVCETLLLSNYLSIIQEFFAQTGITNGYLSVCILTAAPKGYKAPEQNALGNLLVLFLLGGIFSGTALGWLWIIGNGKF